MEAAVLVIPQDRRFDRFWASTENISLGGLFISTPQVLPVDTEVLTTIVPRRNRSVHALAKVVHISEGRGLGCCMVHVPPRSNANLVHWLGRTGGLLPVAGTILDTEN
jgi:hypothetical protein